MKYLILIASIFTVCNVSYTQTTATDFTVNDCVGNSHHLFSELDEGKIIVIAWVMPCGGCINPSQAAYNVVESYATTNPGQVFFYLVDDYANTNCATLTSWAIGNDLDNSTVFSNSAIDMSDYGVDGMPKIVVLAGSEHNICYNLNTFSDGAGVQAVIDSALAVSMFGFNEMSNQNFQLSIFPNPTVNKTLTVGYNLINNADVAFEFYNEFGMVVKSLNLNEQNEGNYEKQVDVSDLSKGTYFLKLTAGEKFDKLKFVIVE